MKKDHSATSEVPTDGTDASTPLDDWSFEEVERVARMLYAHAPFNVKDGERWKALAQRAFDFLDNLNGACQEILTKRMEKREIVGEASERAHAARHLPFRVPFKQAVRFITDENRIDRGLPKFKKVLCYDARRIHPWPWRSYGRSISQSWLSIAPPKLAAERKRQLKAQLKKWHTNGIPRYEVVRLRWLCQEVWPLVKVEQNRAKARKRAKRTDKRRGAKSPK